MKTDMQIHTDILEELRWDPRVKEAEIAVGVNNGWVTLKGDVDWNYQKRAAERAVRYLNGVRGLTNLIAVKPHVSPVEVKAKIEAALRRNAELDAKLITVETKEGKVTLSGHVRSWAERTDAERAAWGAPGVTDVEDRLVVTT